MTRAAWRRAAKVWAPPGRQLPSEWMTSQYVISAEESAEPGSVALVYFEHNM